jgi:hypothetical protein
MAPIYRRKPHILLRAFDGEHFLIDPKRNAIHHLNPTATIIWQLLEEPSATRSVSRDIAALFPNADAKAIARDVRRHLAFLKVLGAIVPATSNTSSRTR